MGFYVSIVRPGRGFRLLAGPYETELDARSKLPEMRKRANDMDAKTCFDFFGTCQVKGTIQPRGIFTPNQKRIC